MTSFDLTFTEDREPFVEALRALPDWGVVRDDQEEPWFKVPLGQVRKGTVLPAAGIALVSLDSEGCEVWVSEDQILQGTDGGCFTLTDEVGTPEEIAQIDLSLLNDEE